MRPRALAITAIGLLAGIATLLPLGCREPRPETTGERRAGVAEVASRGKESRRPGSDSEAPKSDPAAEGDDAGEIGEGDDAGTGGGEAPGAVADPEPARAGLDALEKARRARHAREFDTAEAHLERGLKAVGSGGNPAVAARLWMEKAALLGTSGRARASLEAAQQAISVLRRAAEAAEPQDPELGQLEGRARVRLAEVWNLLGQAAEAEAALAEAARIYDHLGDGRRRASVTLRRSTFANHRGDYPRALELGQHALTELEAAEELDKGSTLKALSNVAYARHRLGDLEEAERDYGRVLEQAWALGDQGTLEFAFCNRAEVRWLRGDPRPALNDLEAAVAGLERARATIRGGGGKAIPVGPDPTAEARAAFLELQVGAFDRLVRYRADTAEPVAAFEAAERFHGRSLSELLDPALELAPRPPSAAEVRAGLRPGEVLIAYWLAEDRLLAWAVDRERIHQVQALVSPGEVRATLAAYLRPLRSAVAAEDSAVEPPSERDEDTARHLELGRRLYGWLVEPLPRWARQAERWIVVPDGPLHYLPFAALPASCESDLGESDRRHAGSPGGRHHEAYARCRFLGFEKALSRAPSAGVVLALRRRDAGRSRPRGGLLAMAPDLPEEPWAAGAREPLETIARARGRLEHHRREARSIVEQMPGALAVLGTAATEARWKSEAPGYRWLHLASHGLMDDDDPMGSGILLVPGGGEDGLLRLPEVLQLELGSRLVTLSACSSGRGRLRRGEGIKGLGQAFLAAGASSLVLSLWDVDDRTTPRLMEAFYRHLSVDAGPAEALRRARASLAKSHDERGLVFRRHRVSLAHPRFWAGFVVLGEG